MKLLWVVNVIFPDFANKLGMESNPSGSWMYSLLDALKKKEGLQISVVTVYQGKEKIYKNVDNIDYYLIPNFKSNWEDIFDSINPNLVHIHGAEYNYGLNLLSTRPNCKYILSIQGIMDACARNYLGGMTTFEVIRNITIRDIIKRDNIFQARKKFYAKAKIEKKYFEKVDAVIGRTEWDKAYTEYYNKDMKYYHCSEMLRKEFLTGEKWILNKCEKFTIFMSGGGYPLKGLHQVLKAIVLIKSEFPNIKLYIAGYNFLESKLKISGYGLYIKSLIKKFDLNKNVFFTGPLNAEVMKKYYLNANVYICASSVENSPNSLLEARILGVPIIASYVGGIPSLLSEKSNYYDFNDYVMLSNMISKIFKCEEFSNTIFEINSEDVVEKINNIYKNFVE